MYGLIEGDATCDYASLLHNVAAFDESHGFYGKAEAKLATAVSIKAIELGVKIPDTLTNVRNIALVLELRENTIGTNHLDTLTSTANLATALQNQGKLEEAKPIEFRVLETRKTILR